MKLFWTIRGGALVAGLLTTLWACKPPSQSSSLNKKPQQGEVYYGGLLDFDIPYSKVTQEMLKNFWESWEANKSLGGYLSSLPTNSQPQSRVDRVDTFQNPTGLQLIHRVLDKYVDTTKHWLKTRCVELNMNDATGSRTLRWDSPVTALKTGLPQTTVPSLNQGAPNENSPLCEFKTVDGVGGGTSQVEIFAPEFFIKDQVVPRLLPWKELIKQNAKNLFQVERIAITPDKSKAIFLVSVNLGIPFSPNSNQTTYYMSGTSVSDHSDPGTYQFFIAGNAVIPRNTARYSPGFALPILLLNERARNGEWELSKTEQTKDFFLQNRDVFVDFGLLVLERWIALKQAPILSMLSPQEELGKWLNRELIPELAHHANTAKANESLRGTYKLVQDLSPGEKERKLHHLPIGSFSFLANAIPTQKTLSSTNGVVFQLNPSEGLQTLRNWYTRLNQMWFAIGSQHVGEAGNQLLNIPTQRSNALREFVTQSLSSSKTPCNSQKLNDFSWFPDGFFAPIHVSIGPSRSNGFQAIDDANFEKAYAAVATSSMLPLEAGCPKAKLTPQTPTPSSGPTGNPPPRGGP